MSIIVHLDRILVERKMTLTELSERVGVTIANLSIFKTNKARAVRFTTLEALCRELDCQPGDLLEYVEDEAIPSASVGDEAQVGRAGARREDGGGTES